MNKYNLVPTRYGYSKLFRNGSSIILEIDTELHGDVMSFDKKRYIQIKADNAFETFLKEICEYCRIDYNPIVWLKLPYKYNRYNLTFLYKDGTLAHSGLIRKNAKVQLVVELTGIDDQNCYIFWTVNRITFDSFNTL